MADTNIQSFTKGFMAVRLGQADNSSQIKSSSADSFSSQLDKTSKQVYKTEEKQTDTTKKSGLNDELKKNQNISKKQKELEEKAAGEAGAATVDNASAAANVTQELKETVAEQLNMSAEELEGLMKSMDFSDIDLFDPEKLGMIVLEANGLTKAQDLLFDKAAADEFKNIMALLDKAVSELEQSGVVVSEEGFLDMAAGESIQVKISNAENNADASAGMSPETEQKMTKDILPEAADMEDSNIDLKSDENVADNADESFISGESTQNVSETQENNSAKQDGHSESKNHRQQNVKSDGGVINNANVRFNPIEEIQVELTDRVGKSQAESIVNQLMERIKFSVNDEFKSMEMQLYPEHLGKVGVHVAIRDGILTAQITAENETVKNAIEAQLINLKESFNNQGLKVENVEVTIASHSFEENNMGNQDEQSNQGKSKRNRRINSSLIDELNGITDEQSEDAVMETLGNTVSYTA